MSFAGHHGAHPVEDMVAAVARRLRRARRVLFVTGAGISADSGLPTYRGVGGLYEDATTSEGYTIEDALSGEVLRRHPDITWKYLAQIERTCRGALPNPAHRVIARLEERVPQVVVFTQNVDGLHADAGSTNVIEIHGNLRQLHCVACAHEREVRDYGALDIPPACPACGQGVRPRVVLFGEMLPLDALRRFEEEMARGFDLVFSIGTSARFPYVVQPLLWSRAGGVPTVEVNPDETELSRLVDFPLRMRAAPAMERIWELLIGSDAE